VSQVTRRVLPLATLLFCASAPLRLSAQESRPAWELGVRGTILMNGFYNDNKVNNSDVPAFAMPADAPGSLPMAGLGGAIRQTRLISTGDLAGFGGGDLHAELDVDFYGGQLGNGRTSPLLRIRRAFGEVKWARASLLIGQEGPLVADVNPRGLATVGIPGYASAGNLWLWIPQIRAGYDLTSGDGVRLGIDIAALAPTTEEPQNPFATAPNTAERSGRPMLEGRLRARWGEGGELAVGGHTGSLATTGDTLLTTTGVVVTGIVPLGPSLELRGEWFTGKGLVGLGGGAIGQPYNSDGEPLESTGGWAQLNVEAGPRWEFGVGFGYDDPNGTAADEGNVAFRDKNTQYGARVQWRPAPVVVAFEYRHFATEWGGGIGERTASHLNLAAGVEF
jgi:hypothetical protein